VFATVRQRVEAAGAQRAERTIFQLEENFRMNEPLTAYPREAIYAGRFFAARPAVRARLARAPRPADPVERLLFPEEPALLATYQPPRSFTARNPLEAEIAADLVARLAELLIDERTGVVYTPEAFAAEGIAVLAPHRAQNSAIRQALLLRGFGTEERPMPVVDTVDKLQGQERDVVIVSYGVADAEYAEAEAEFLLSSNRFNVAATRARHKLIVLCAAPVLGVVPTDRSVLLDAMMLKEYRAYCNSGETQISYGELDLTVAWKSFEGSPPD
jgi:ATP-dependent exoDNAse (exonuclease V) beta subunit